MRLINADALKEDFKSRLALCNDWIEKAKDKETKIRASAVKTFIGEVIMTIDNAPTVIWCSETPEGLPLIDLRVRPQGAWNYIQAGMAVCPFCGGTRRDNRIDHISFCNKCGAKMKGGKAE